MQDEWDFGDLSDKKKMESISNDFDDWDLGSTGLDKKVKAMKKIPKDNFRYQKEKKEIKNDWDEPDEDDWDVDDPTPKISVNDNKSRQFCQNRVMGYNSRMNNGSMSKTQKSIDTKIKCLNPYLTVENSGFVNGLDRVGCENLICRDCGIRIIKIKDHVWDNSTTNYLFFRTNFGDKQRLQKGLVQSPGSAAFSCGCKGKSVSQGGDKIDPYFGWKCTGCYH